MGQRSLDVGKDAEERINQIFRLMTFSGATFSSQDDGDKRRMAATVAEGTAPKPVQVNAGASAGRPYSGNKMPRTTL